MTADSPAAKPALALARDCTARTARTASKTGKLGKPGVRRLPLALRDAQLLAWLALEGPTARTRLATLLWPDSDAEAARNSLRQRLFQLRKQLGMDVVVGSGTLALAAGVEHDLADSDSVLGETAADSSEFGHWLVQQRASRRGRMRQSLVELAEMAERVADYADALVHAQELLALEPISEDAHRRVMRLHYLGGDRAAALLAFDRCEQMLKDEVGTPPSAETLALLATISAAQTAGTATVTQTVPASVLRPPRLIGRDAELAALQQGWQAGQVVALIGEAGMGKTRLLQGFIDGQAGVVRAAGRPGDAGVPFATLARLLRALMTNDAAPARLHEQLPAATRSEIARVLPEFDVPAARHTGEGQRLVMQRALRDLLATTGLAGLVLDDLHFADAASLDMLGALIDEDGNSEVAALAAERTPLRWALAYRPAQAGSPVQALHDALVEQARLVPIALAPLNEEALAALLDSLALPGVDGKALAPPLLRHTGGNPLYLLETLKALHLQGSAGILQGAGVTLPTARNVVQLIGRRLTQLSPAAMKLARCAAVAGQDFSTALAIQVLAVGPLDIADAWTELEAAQVLRGAAFAHDLIHDATSATVPAALARRLHALIAQALAAQGGSPQRLAAHWLASDTPEQAVPCLLEAGRLAARALCLDEACAAHLKAADLLQSGGRSNEAFQALMALLNLLYAPASEQVQAVLDRMDQLAVSAQERALIADRRGDLLARSGDFFGAGQLAEQALSTLQVEDHPAQASLLLCRLAAGHVAQSQHGLAVECMHRAVDLAARSGDVQAQSTAAGFLGSVLDHAHRYAEAYLAYRREYERTLARSHAPMELISLASNIAGNRIQLGLFDAAMEMVQECYRLAGEEAIDLAAQWPSLRAHHANALFGLAEYTQALRCFEDALADIATHMPSWLPAVHNMKAALWMHLGQWARARQAADTALAGADSLPRYRARTLQLRAQIAAALHETSPASLLEPIETRDVNAGPLLRHQEGLAHTLMLAPADGYKLACRLRDEALACQMPNHVLEAEARCASSALRAGLQEQAARHAREALRRMTEVTPTSFYRGEVWLAAANALAATAPLERQQVLGVAATWIRETARLRVPQEFRDSFLHRNPINRDLLALASKLSC